MSFNAILFLVCSQHKEGGILLACHQCFLLIVLWLGVFFAHKGREKKNRGGYKRTRVQLFFDRAICFFNVIGDKRKFLPKRPLALTS